MLRVVLAVALAVLLGAAPPGRSPSVADALREHADARQAAALRAAPPALFLAGPFVGQSGLLSATAAAVERRRCDRVAVHVVAKGTSYHRTARCQTLRKSKDVSPASLTDARTLGHRPCLSCSPPE